MNIEVWITKSECWACGEQTVLWYPPAVGSYDGGTWDPVGRHLSNLPDCPIEQAYSETQERTVWGNRCESCDEYYGNFYVHQDAQLAALHHGEDAIRTGEVTEYDVINVDLPLACRMCGHDDVKLPSELCASCLPDLR